VERYVENCSDADTRKEKVIPMKAIKKRGEIYILGGKKKRKKWPRRYKKRKRWHAKEKSLKKILKTL